MNRILLFLACMFIGMGVGMLFAHTGAGTILGMGIGLLFIAFAPDSSTKSVRIGRKITSPGRVFLGIIGIGFILWGLEMLGIIVIPGTLWQHLGAFILILIGIGFLYAALS